MWSNSLKWHYARVPIQPEGFWAAAGSNKRTCKLWAGFIFSESNETVINLSGYLITNKFKIGAKQYYKGKSDIPKAQSYLKLIL